MKWLNILEKNKFVIITKYTQYIMGIREEYTVKKIGINTTEMD